MQASWLTKKEAAGRLGLGLRRTLDLAHNGTLKTTKERDPQTHQMAVRFDAGDIERYLNLRRTPARTEPQSESVRGAVLAEPKIRVRSTPRMDRPLESAVLPGWLSVIEALKPPAVPIAQKLYLSTDEAAAYSGLPKTYLRKLVRAGTLQAVKQGRWCIRRSALETL